MSHPLRIQRSRRKGWRKPPGAVIVDRTSHWGNPFPIEVYGRDEAIRRYELYLVWHRPDLLERLPELTGRLLACFCKLDEPCHGDVLARLANRPEAVEALPVASADTRYGVRP